PSDVYTLSLHDALPILGALMALGLTRYRVRGQGTMNMLVFLPMATPEIVMGSSLLTLFLNSQFAVLGFETILIAHIMFNISYVRSEEHTSELQSPCNIV